MTTTFVCENKKYALLTSDATNPLFEEYTGREDPELLGELYLIVNNKTHNPVAVATVRGSSFSVYTATDKIDVESDTSSDTPFNPSDILDVFTASRL